MPLLGVWADYPPAVSLEPVMVLMPRVTIVDADKISDEAAAAVAERLAATSKPRR
jgi:hypothetical protein